MSLLDHYQNILAGYKTAVIDEVKEKLFGEKRVNTDDYAIYLVEIEEETIQMIAYKFGVNLEKLKKINSFDDYNVKVYSRDEKVKIPVKIYTVQKSEGIITIIRKHNISTDTNKSDYILFLQMNNLDIKSTIHEGKKIKVFDKSSDKVDTNNKIDEFGHYYHEDGTYIKSGSKSTNSGKVYILTKDTQDNFIYLNLMNSPITHIDFLQLAAVAYNEEGESVARKTIIGVMLNRLKKGGYWGNNINEVLGKIAGSGVGTTHEARLNSNIFGRYTLFFKSNMTQRNQNSDFKDCIESVVHILNGGIDYSNGAVYWHGIDFFIPERTDANGNTIQNAAYHHEYIPKGFRWDSNGIYKGNYNSNNKKNWERLGSSSKDYQYIGVATHGNSIYMINILD